MIVITVQSYNGQAVTGLSASFDELGGTIGRADTNQLVLSDPERSVSRVHAEIVFRRGSHALIDRGSNAVLVNGQPLGAGREAPLGDGDLLTIGGYVLQVSVGGQTLTRDPFADLFGGAVTPPAPLAAVRPAAAPAMAWPAPQAGAQAPTAIRPLTSLAPAAPASSAATAAGLPSDWDPFAPAPAPAPSGPAPGVLAGAVPGGPLDLLAPAPMASPAAADSLDALFNLGSPAPGAAPAAYGSFTGGGRAPAAADINDPFAGTPLAAPAVQANTSAQADPWQALGSAPAAPPATMGDAGSDLNAPWATPPLRPSAAPLAAPLAGPTPVGAAPVGMSVGGPLAAPAPAPAPLAGAVLSWEQPSRESKVITLPGASRAPAPGPGPGPAAPATPLPAGPAVQPEPGALTMILGKAGDPLAALGAASGPAPAAALEPAPAPALAPAPPHGALPPAPPPVGAASWPEVAAPHAPTDTAAWQRALADGLGLPAERLRTLDASQMRLIGSLLREATQGAVELLLARAALKREMRTDVTTIAARENNPLKFSPSVEMALLQLLGEPTPGFLPPAAAMRDAFDDLRAHQVGMMGGMRAALDGVVKRFEPAQLEARITHRGGLASLLPGARKAQLWEQFQALYAQLSVEATDDFQTLFGQAFRAAYEAHIEQIQRQP